MSQPLHSPRWCRLRGGDCVISLRLIASLAVAGLVAATILIIAAVNERTARQALRAETEARLLLEARYLATLSSKALLSEFPELTLVPVVRDLQDSRPNLPLAVVVDHRGIVQGHAEPRAVGKPFEPLTDLRPLAGHPDLGPGELIRENDRLLVAEARIQHPGQEDLGRAIVGLDKQYLDGLLRAARLDVIRFAAFLLPGATLLAALMVSLLLRPIPVLRAGLERIGRGDLDTPMTVTDPTELGLLARSVNTMSEQLKSTRALAEEREREIVDTQKEIIHTLGDVVESRSSETANHTIRVGAMSERLALLAGLSAEDAEMLRLASPMHDVGKIGIPDSILNKPGKLTEVEYEIMKNHAAIGHRILAKSERPILKAAAIIAHQHHEQWAGGGYPQGLSGEHIHAFGRIVSLVDVFDALYSDRVYRPAMTLAKTLEIIREERGLHFQPELVDLFLAHLDEFLELHDRYRDDGKDLDLTELSNETALIEAVLAEEPALV